jgi:diguanylate cyclase (GGDEF)-like protein
MRIKRTVPKSGTAQHKVASEASATSATALKVLAPPARSHASKGRDASSDPSAERHPASVESMFLEISSLEPGGPGGPGASDGTPPATRYDDLWQLSLADPVTGLANRMLLLDRLTRELTRCQRHGGCVVVSHIDLGNLKDINDQLGYPSGNEVLRGMSRRLTSMLRSEDTVSRVGESELVAVMTIENERFVGPLMQRVQDVLDNPIAVTGGRVQVAAILGTVTARSAESAEEVLARAGAAA